MNLPLNEIVQGDCLSAMKAWPANCIDAIVTDPPYGLEFMGKEWDRLGEVGRDRSKAINHSAMGAIMGARTESPRIMRSRRRHCRTCGGYSGGPFPQCACDSPDWDRDPYPQAMQHWHEGWAVEALRVAKPGAFLLAFGGTRTWHRLACAIEDAGWEIRDTIMWLHGQGFPKSLDIGKALDKAAGAEREVVGKNPTYRKDQIGAASFTLQRNPNLTAPATDAAKLWDGYGTALKPAFEPIVVAMKPLDGTFAENALKWGVAGLSIDRCRVDVDDGTRNRPPSKPSSATYAQDKWTQDRANRKAFVSNGQGRWPANLVLDEEAAKMLNEQAGIRKSGKMKAGTRRQNSSSGGRNCYAPMAPDVVREDTIGDSGGVSRFFYCAKASPSERGSGNRHPTVKPLALMCWLCRLVAPPTGSIILDPFAGSGTTCLAAKLEGCQFIGIEKEPKYVKVARTRLSAESGRLF